MELEQLKAEMDLLTEKEQDAMAAYLLYLRLKRNPDKVKSLQQKLTSVELADWEPYEE